MTESNQNDAAQVINAIRTEATKKIITWIVASAAALIAIMFAGWWLYLKPIIVKQIGGVPRGAVMAFDRDDLSPDSCPDGWVPFLEGRARVLVGAGDTKRAPAKMGFDERNNPLISYVLRQHGGEQSHELSILEMPVHNHYISVNRKSHENLVHDALGGNDKAYYGIDTNFDSSPADGGYGVLSKTISNNGGGAAHNNMPPFIAVYYCKKIE